MVLQALYAKKFFANGLSAIPRRQTTRAFKGAAQEDFQFDLSAARISPRVTMPRELARTQSVFMIVQETGDPRLQ